MAVTIAATTCCATVFADVATNFGLLAKPIREPDVPASAGVRTDTCRDLCDFEAVACMVVHGPVTLLHDTWMPWRRSS